MRLAADETQNTQRNALVEIPFLYRRCDDETAEVQQDDPVHILASDIWVNNIEIAKRDAAG